MAIERWEMEQRKKGNVAGAEMAKVLRAQYGDVPLPQSIQDISREVPTIKIQRFTPEARAGLERAGYAIHALTGQSIQTLRKAGNPFWSTWHNERPDIEELTSRLSEVAIHPHQLFIPDSNKKNLKKQLEMIKKFSKELSIDGVEAILGTMPDYVELVFAHLHVTGDRLFGKNYNYGYTRTTTPTGESSVAHVGDFGVDNGLFVLGWDPSRRAGSVFAAPLVVPKIS